MQEINNSINEVNDILNEMTGGEYGGVSFEEAKLFLEPTANFNMFVKSLINKIGRTEVKDTSFINPLAKFRGKTIDYGHFIEDIWVDTPKREKYNVFGSVEKLFKMRKPRVKTYYHGINREDQYPITISYSVVKEAFNNPVTYQKFRNAIIESVFNKATDDEYIYMNNLITKFIEDNDVVKKYISYPNTYEKSVTMLQKIRAEAGKMSFQSRKYNPAHIKKRTNINNLSLLITSEMNSNLEVRAIAEAFNINKRDYNIDIIEVDEFVDSDIACVLIDEDFYKVSNIDYVVTSIDNPSALYYNFFLTIREVMSTSKFGNFCVFYKTEKELEDNFIKDIDITVENQEFIMVYTNSTNEKTTKKVNLPTDVEKVREIVLEELGEQEVDYIKVQEMIDKALVGYATEEYVDNSLDKLNIISKEEILSMINEAISGIETGDIDYDKVGEIIEEKLLEYDFITEDNINTIIIDILETYDYVTQDELTNKLNELNIISKEEILSMINEAISGIETGDIDYDKVGEIIEEKLSEYDFITSDILEDEVIDIIDLVIDNYNFTTKSYVDNEINKVTLSVNEKVEDVDLKLTDDKLVLSQTVNGKIISKPEIVLPTGGGGSIKNSYHVIDFDEFLTLFSPVESNRWAGNSTFFLDNFLITIYHRINKKYGLMYLTDTKFVVDIFNSSSGNYYGNHSYNEISENNIKLKQKNLTTIIDRSAKSTAANHPFLPVGKDVSILWEIPKQINLPKTLTVCEKGVNRLYTNQTCNYSFPTLSNSIETIEGLKELEDYVATNSMDSKFIRGISLAGNPS